MKSLVLATVLLLAGAVSADAAACDDLAQWVDPVIGTLGEGNAFPGAAMPFGMVQASPDTGRDNTHASGFKYADDVIRGFSQTHLSGTGGAAGGDGAFLPFTGEAAEMDFASGYDKASMTATPGYFRCRLTRYGVTVEATAAERTGWYRLSYAPDAAAKVLVDTAAYLGRGHLVKYGPVVRRCDTELDAAAREIRCVREVTMWEGPRKVAFVYRFSHPWLAAEPLPTDRFLGRGARYALDFGKLAGPLEVQVAVSYSSTAAAVKNLSADTEGRTFETVREANRAAWNGILSRMTVDGVDEDRRRCWYTAVYRLCLQPNLHSDAGEKDYYTTFSLWDTYRAAHPLYTLLVPERVQGFVDSLWREGKEHGHLPMWLLYGGETHDMIGVHSIPVLVDAYRKGWRPAEGGKMLDFMIESLTGAEKECPAIAFSQLFDYGYIPYTAGPFCEKHVPCGSVSRTLELAYDWSCVARFARLLGNEATAAKADRFAASWRNLYDQGSGFMRARSDNLEHDGGWRTPFDPLKNCQTDGFWGDYTEANAYVYTWHVFQEPEALVAMMGGREAALAKLDRLFDTWPTATAKRYENNDEGGVLVPGQLGQYWQGNEPSHHIPYFYTLLGHREKTAAIVSRLCREAYRSGPDGLCGNDDCGQMSAWYLFSSMGFYPFDPASGEYVLGAPQVPWVELRSGNGAFTVTSGASGRESGFRGQVLLNGHPVPDGKLRHSEILAGGKLEFGR